MGFFNTKPLSLIDSLKENETISIIAEIKKASPSKGIIRKDFNHKKIADIYFDEGVEAVSILTDKNFFQGDMQYLSDIAKDKRVPLLRKDFIIDEYQIFESKAFGADMILLISEALSKDQINELSHAAYECDLEVLLELHSANQLEKINFDVNKLIGINNRNLENFSVNLETTLKISQKIPDKVYIVSESGINTKSDVNLLQDIRTNAILVGEYLMKAEDIKAQLKELKEWCQIES
jgi:indole-3-glycerol phosphate synthase